MDIFIQQLINGLVLGSIYALIALGYTMVYGVLGIINFAHGDVLMIGALSALSAINFLNYLFPAMPLWTVLIIALLFAMMVCALLAYFIERFAYRPLRNAPRLAPLITAIGVSIMLETLGMMIWSRNPRSFPQILSSSPIQVGHTGATIMGREILIIAVSLAVMATLLLIVNHSKLGRAMRATAENPRVATLMGVNPNFVISATFMIGAVMAAIAGVMMATNYGSARFDMGFIPGLKAFTAAVLGGIGNLGGAMLGGLLLGLLEALFAGYSGQLTGGVIGSDYQDVLSFFVLIGVLIFKPSGLLGERVADRS